VDIREVAPAGPHDGHEGAKHLHGLPWRVAGLILLSGMGALLIAAILEMQAGATAYIVGEGHWSKAQQRTVHSLYRYAGQGDPADLAEARQALRVPLGDRDAREALDRRPVDLEAARRGFLQGENAPGDIERIVWMYRLFSDAPFFRDSVRLWKQAETDILRLAQLADELERRHRDGPLEAAEIAAYQQQLDGIDRRLRPTELAFSRALADGSRMIRGALLGLSLLAVLVLSAYALRLMWCTLRHVRETESEFRVAFHQSVVGMLKMDREGRFTQANEALAGILDQPLCTLRQWRLEQVLLREDLPRDAAGGIDWPRMMAPGERRLLRADGSVRWVRWTASMVAGRSPAQDQVFVLMEDVSDAHALACEIAHQASHDELTGLINRREIARRLERALTQARAQRMRHALCYIDLDQFKLVNDSCGHEAGDRFLCHFASVLSAHLRRDDWLGRLGGDEFAVLLHDTTLEGAEAAMARVHAMLATATFQWDGRTFGLNCSIGVAEMNESAGDVDWLLRAADAACYVAKEEGRNRIRGYRDSDPTLSRRRHELEWVAHTQLAISEKRLCLHAQRIVPLDGSDRLQYEVLVRLLDRDGVLHAPGAFLPAMERYGQALAVDRYVVDAVFEQLAASPAHLACLDLCHVNVSAQSIAEPAFLEHVDGLLARHPQVASRLCFEITETAVIGNLDDACRFIDVLHAHGCRVALDDFGSGLSSFGYLKQLAVDILKIDGSFIRDLSDGESDVALVRSMSQMGRALGKETIAEWVESEAVMRQLADLGICHVQGYGVHVPCPLPDLVAAWSYEEAAQAGSMRLAVAG